MILWEELKTTDFAPPRFRDAVALLPVAAIEQHGPHLPLGVDAMICTSVLDAAAACLSGSDGSGLVLRLPVQKVGVSPEHQNFPGTLSLTPEQALGVWTELGRGVAAAGVLRLVIFNSHGGQISVVDQLALRLRHSCGMLVVRAHIAGLADLAGLAGLAAEIDETERRFGLHGGLVETSVMLATRPHLVDMDRARDFRSRDQDSARPPGLPAEGAGVGIGWLAEDLHPDGVTGNAAAATAALGARVLAAYGAGLAHVIRAAAGSPLPGETGETGAP